MTIDEIIRTVEKMCMLIERGEFAPILEADICGFLFHSMVEESLCPLSRIHLSTRVVGAPNPNSKFDLAVGDLELREDNRHGVRPEIVVEVKAFPTGFTPVQCRRRFEQIMFHDLSKLASLRADSVLTAAVVYDESGYLAGQYENGSREDAIIAKRKQVAERTNLIFARAHEGRWQVYGR